MTSPGRNAETLLEASQDVRYLIGFLRAIVKDRPHMAGILTPRIAHAEATYARLLEAMAQNVLAKAKAIREKNQ